MFLLVVWNFRSIELTKVYWRIYVSINYATICSDKGLSPAQRKAIIWTNTGLSEHFQVFF